MSENARWEELQRLFHSALQREPAARAAFVNSVGDEALRRELASLLANETSSDGWLEQPAMGEAARQLALDALAGDALEPETTIGPYRILATIGHGGMGVVYRAEQQHPVKRQVALKVLRPGLEGHSVLARFQAERQTLAVMNHPGIARVFDAGATDAGWPYFVMELVEGPPVTEYCARQALDLRSRLGLFIRVGQAIQHAHQKGIIHRDIKPANVLVATYDGQPAPKVIDFGIAKMLAGEGPHTQWGAVMGTPDYMSPEQAAGGDIDTRADIYALGALLYEMLAGVTPLGLASKEDTIAVLRRIREDEPPPPSARLSSAAAKPVRGELDWIVMKALEKDRARRYESAGALIQDLENYLAGAPVAAGPPSTFYRLRKVTHRYRWPLASAAALLAILTGATVFSAWQAILARRAERSAAAVSGFLRDDLLAQASANVQSFGGTRPDPDLKVRTALDRAAARVERRFGQEPLIEAAVRQTLGEAYFDLGLYTEARRHALRSVDLRRRELGPREPDTLAAEHLLLSVDLGLGQPKDGASRAMSLWEARRQALGPRHPDTLAALEARASVERAFKRDAAALAILKEVASVRREVLGAEHRDTLKALSSLGLMHFYQDRFAEARQILSEVLASRRRALGEEHQFTVDSRNALALALTKTGESAEATRLLTEVLAWRRRVLGPAHRETLATLNALGIAAADPAWFTECIAVATPALGEHHPSAAACRRNLANLLSDQGKNLEAARVYEAFVTHDLRTLGPESPDTLRDMSNLAAALGMAGRVVEAKAMIERVITLRRKVLGPRDTKTIASVRVLADIHWQARRYEDARRCFEEVVAAWRQELGLRNERTLGAVTSLAYVLLELGRAREAEPLLREALAGANKADVWTRGLRESLLGWSLAGRSPEAAAFLRDGHRDLAQSASSRAAPDRGEVERAARRLELLKNTL